MKNQAPWAGKVFDEPRIGFVAEYGSQLHPLAKPPEPPPPPAASPLDKIVDEDRLGFAEAQRADEIRIREALASKVRYGRGKRPSAAG
ncbi:hypothetical protein [Tardiphaga sp.]|jgi:hypothetical protein|uniref:hypothetical protein n=1 Tax=Tardiphaga sp. TaxID=1926292 RepID=UPI0037DA17A8